MKVNKYNILSSNQQSKSKLVQNVLFIMKINLINHTYTKYYEHHDYFEKAHYTKLLCYVDFNKKKSLQVIVMPITKSLTLFLVMLVLVPVAYYKGIQYY